MHYGTFVSRHATRHPERVALVDEVGTRTYRELDERTDRLANALHAKGLTDGDRVALVTDNRLECVEVMVGVAKAGLVFVPLDFRLDDRAAAHLLRHSGSRVTFFGASHGEQVARLSGVDGAGAPVESWIGLDEQGPGGYEQLLADAAPDPLPPSADDAGFCILYTSGTTGLPKGVYFTHQQTMDNAMAVLVEFGIDADTRYLVSYPHNSAGSVNHVFGPVLMAGGRLVLGDVRGFDAERYFAVVERERVTHGQLVPTMVFRLLSSDADRGRDLSSLTTVGYASAPIPAPKVREMLARFGPIFVQAYGMTETCSFATVLTRADHETVGTAREGVLASCGRATYGVEVTIVDDDDRPVPPGATGEVVMRGRWLFQSYWDDPELTGETYRGGWLHSGDVGYLDEEGYLYLVDRKKDLLIIGGANIASKEIEDALYEVPGVLEAAVIGVPDEEWGERPHAVVVPRPGATIAVDAVLAHCREHLPSIKRPVAVTVRDALPKTSTGKISKPELRRQLVPAPS